LLIAKADQTVWRVYHENYAVAYGPASVSTYRYRGRLHVAGAGTCQLIEPGECHVTVPFENPADYDVVFFDPHSFLEAAREIGVKGVPHFLSGAAKSPALCAAVNRFSRSVEANEDAFAQQTWRAICIQLMLDLAERKPSSLSASDQFHAVNQARSHLIERLEERVTLDELAFHSGIDKYRLARLFTRHIGLPPHAFQNRVRVERGRILLKTGMAPATAAAAVGFADQSHFTRHFKRVLGITPARYASAVR